MSICLKKQWQRKKQADNHLRKLRRTGFMISQDVHSYWCEHCAAWHTGHKSKYEERYLLKEDSNCYHNHDKTV